MSVRNKKFITLRLIYHPSRSLLIALKKRRKCALVLVYLCAKVYKLLKQIVTNLQSTLNQLYMRLKREIQEIGMELLKLVKIASDWPAIIAERNKKLPR